MSLYTKNVVLFLLVLLFSFQSNLEARGKRGFFLITHGEEISFVARLSGEVAEGVKESTGVNDFYVGFKYNQFGIIFIELWSWGGEFCLYSESRNEYIPIGSKELEELRQNLPVSIGKPLLYTFPLGFIIVLIGGGIFLGIKFMGMNNPEEKARKRYESLTAESKYSKAVDLIRNYKNDLIQERGPDAPIEKSNEQLMEEAIEKAVNFLASKGVNKEEAIENMAFITGYRRITFRNPKKPVNDTIEME